MVLRWRDVEWLRKQRATAGSSGMLAGKLGCRILHGHPAVRWEEGVLVARLTAER